MPGDSVPRGAGSEGVLRALYFELASSALHFSVNIVARFAYAFFEDVRHFLEIRNSFILYAAVVAIYLQQPVVEFAYSVVEIPRRYDNQ